MGKPLNKKYFGDVENEIHMKVYFHNGTATAKGWVTKQIGSKKFRCIDKEENTAVCTLVQKWVQDPNKLSPRQMVMMVELEDGKIAQVGKIANRQLTVVSLDEQLHNTIHPWDFINETESKKATVPFRQVSN